jgi:hypothetical protein
MKDSDSFGKIPSFEATSLYLAKEDSMASIDEKS